MSERYDAEAVPIREAATLVLLRERALGTEVFMVRRTTSAVFSAGAHVFPGGALDDALLDRCEGLDDLRASKVLGLVSGGLGYFVAAIRECFEEAGMLLARRERHADGELVRLDDAHVAQRFDDHRDALCRGTRSFLQICRAESLTLATDLLAPFGHWVTPLGPPRRFDTRFFVAHAPDAQDASHDGQETTEAEWARPIDLLGRAHRGEIDLILPTRRTLEALCAS